jgi:hypothetical protein
MQTVHSLIAAGSVTWVLHVTSIGRSRFWKLLLSGGQQSSCDGRHSQESLVESTLSDFWTLARIDLFGVSLQAIPTHWCYSAPTVVAPLLQVHWRRKRGRACHGPARKAAYGCDESQREPPGLRRQDYRCVYAWFESSLLKD